MKRFLKARWLLVVYDSIIFMGIAFMCFKFPTGYTNLTYEDIAMRILSSYAILFVSRILFKNYNRIWRFEGTGGYLAIILSDIIALGINLIVQPFLPGTSTRAFVYIAIFALDTIVCLGMRMCYRYIFRNGTNEGWRGKLFEILLKVFTLNRVKLQKENKNKKINIAIAGAGRVGVALMEELKSNPNTSYRTEFFIDNDTQKTGKNISGIAVYPQDRNIYGILNKHEVKEVVIAIPDLNNEERSELFDFYKKSECKVKIYDFPTTNTASSKRQMRDFDIEDLMPRKEIIIKNPLLQNFYNNKTVLITGGGGSIGSELARQIAQMEPKQLILLDIYENGIYDLQQELKIKHGSTLDLQIEIASVTDVQSLEHLFKKYKPEVIIHAAAHKHVPLMEHNGIEAVKNNIFGTKNVIELAEKYNAYKFMMVSTDKAVNPTNVMGATKRFCELMVQSANAKGKVRYGATRFGNVLGSAGSVVPLFKRQIANGGPVTITDKRIMRYFMTIPEACNLVLQSSVMANNGELFVLDMGHPVRILDLAQNMIEISGVPNIEIKEIGLRPGEKLFEELLIDYKYHNKTSNDLIFVEKETQPMPQKEIDKILDDMQHSIDDNDSDKLIEILKGALPEFKNPEEVNYKVIQANA